MNYKLLNDMIDYIEDNLTNDIEYKKLAKIVGVSDYSLQRIFIFLTGISISEYIRKRRLSRAFEELKLSDIKIIDLAVKYNYDSSVSFSRAFKNFFGMTPSECRNSDIGYKLFPVIRFNNDNNLNYEVSFEIKKLEKKEIYCFGVKDKVHEDLLFKIRELYRVIKDNGIRDIFDKHGMYGISICNNDRYEYYVGSEVNLPNTKKMIIDSGLYAVFESGSIEQKDINRVYDFVYSRWINSTNYEVIDSSEIEFYTEDNCYIYIPIKDKQK